jgi:hypothetical protein
MNQSGTSARESRCTGRNGARVSAEILLLCLSGSLYPLALVTIIHYLGGERRLPRSFAFAAGGVAITAVTGTLIVVLVRGAGLTREQHPTPSALFDVVVGAGLVAFSTVLLLRDNRRRVEGVDAGKPAAGDANRPADDGSLWRAFLAGVAIYLPMLSYFAAVKIVAGRTSGLVLTGLSVFVCIVVTLLVVEVAIALAALAGERSDALLKRMSQLVTRYTKPVLLLAGVAVGIYLIVKGVLAL